MIKEVNLNHNNKYFRSKQPEKKVETETHILPTNLKTSTNQSIQKTMSAIIDYPVKGLKGDINSNFYEFLTMGIVPYLLGSGMFMIVFNALNSKGILGAKDKAASSIFGKKMALGVVLYGVLKSLSKKLVTKPIKVVTGVDTEMPYQNKVYNLPKGTGKDAEIEVQWQQRKVFDSKEFFRKDLLDREYFDKVARKIGLGENLNDSVSETTPIIQNIVATSNTAKTLSSYCWAATGVGLAMQDSWIDLFNKISTRNHYHAKEGAGILNKTFGKIKTFWSNAFKISTQFFKSFIKSFSELWKGNPGYEGFRKHSGKFLLGTSILVTILTTVNSIKKAKNMAKNSNINKIDQNKETTVI